MKNYISAEIELFELQATDLITTSGENNIGEDKGENDGEWISGE